MSIVKWMLEKDVFDEGLDPIIQSIQRQGFDYKIITYVPFESGQYNQFHDDDCVICYGSLNWIRQMSRQKPWVGVYCNLPNFECVKYYAYFGKYLLNHDYLMMPLSELKRKYQHVCKTLGSPFFLRPSTGFKNFTGQLITNLDRDFNWIDEFTSPEMMVIASSRKKIKNEYRFVVADKKVIAGSLYKQRGELLSKRYNPKEHPREAFNLAQLIASEKWEPDRLYTIDIGEWKNQMHLIEINSFSASGWYECDSDIIVKEASEIALSEWKDLQN